MSNSLTRRGFIGTLGGVAAAGAFALRVPSVSPGPALAFFSLQPDQFLTGLILDVNTRGVEQELVLIIDGVAVEHLRVQTHERRKVTFHLVNGPHRIRRQTMGSKRTVMHLCPLEPTALHSPTAKLYVVNWLTT